MKKTYEVGVQRIACARVTVEAESESEAIELALQKAHETIGLNDYTYWGEFEYDEDNGVYSKDVKYIYQPVVFDHINGAGEDVYSLPYELYSFDVFSSFEAAEAWLYEHDYAHYRIERYEEDDIEDYRIIK